MARPLRNRNDGLYKGLARHEAHLSAGRSLLRAPLTGRSFALPEPVARLLAQCSRFRTLGAHTDEAVRQLGLARTEARELHSALEWLADNGLLVSRDDALAALAGSGRGRGGARPRITVIGIPTADRPRLLRRALESFGRNAERFGRDVEFIVVDDSRTRQAEIENEAVVASSRWKRRILYFGRRERAALIRRLTRRGLDPEVLQFALRPRHDGHASTGAARNVLLLLGAGRLSLQIDDDTLARTAALPAADGRRTVFSSAENPFVHHFDTWAGLRALVREECDVLGAHERLLASTLADCVPDAASVLPDIDGLSERFLHDLAHGGSTRVRTTAFGAIGDAGTRSMVGLMLKVGEADRASLLRSDDVYRTAILERRILRSTLAPTITHSSFCMTMNLGLDGIELLPPFLPVFRGQDGVFGTLLRMSGAFVGYVPEAILHAPHPRRRVHGAEIGRHAAPLCVSHHVTNLLDLAAPRGGGPLHAVLPSAGQRLRALAEEEAFPEIVLREARKRTETQLVRATGLLDRAERERASYKRALRQVIDDMADSLARPSVHVHEWPRGATAGLRRCVSSFGRLLELWPEIDSAARKGWD